MRPTPWKRRNSASSTRPNGIIGLECAYGVCHKILVDGGFISDERLIELMSTGPAELMGHDKTDITAVLDDYADAVPGDDDTKRVLDLGRVPESDRWISWC